MGSTSKLRASELPGLLHEPLKLRAWHESHLCHVQHLQTRLSPEKRRILCLPFQSADTCGQNSWQMSLCAVHGCNWLVASVEPSAPLTKVPPSMSQPDFASVLSRLLDPSEPPSTSSSPFWAGPGRDRWEDHGMRVTFLLEPLVDIT